MAIKAAEMVLAQRGLAPDEIDVIHRGDGDPGPVGSGGRRACSEGVEGRQVLGV